MQTFAFIASLKHMRERTNSLQWRHPERDGVANHRRLDCSLNRLFRPRSNKTSNTGLCEGKLPVNSEFPAQRTSNAENVSIWWRHHETYITSKSGTLIWTEIKMYRGIITSHSILWVHIFGFKEIVTKNSYTTYVHWMAILNILTCEQNKRFPMSYNNSC